WATATRPLQMQRNAPSPRSPKPSPPDFRATGASTVKHEVKPRWKPGESGNPRGRPKGTPNPSTKLRRMIDAEAIVKKLETVALAGDVQAARTLLERALPVYRLTAEPVKVDGIEGADTLTDK